MVPLRYSSEWGACYKELKIPYSFPPTKMDFGPMVPTQSVHKSGVMFFLPSGSLGNVNLYSNSSSAFSNYIN